MNLFFVSFYIIWLSISLSPTAARSDSEESTDEVSDTHSEDSSQETKKKPKPLAREGLYFDPTFYFHGNLRQELAMQLFLHNGVKTMACSPVALLMPLAKLLLGAQGKCKKELLEAIGEPQSQIKDTFQWLITRLSNLPGMRLSIGNRIYVSDNVKVNKTFDRESREIFGSALFNTSDFEDFDEIVRKMNAWVARETVGAGPVELNFKPSDIVSAALINVATFSAFWKSGFNNITVQDFYSPEGVMKVPMMSQREVFKCGNSTNLASRLIEMPYLGDRSSFVIVLPYKKDGLLHLVERIKTTPELLNDALLRLPLEMVDLTIPKFKVKFIQDLKPIYESVGVHRIFRSNSSLTGIIEDETLTISSAQQVTIINVHERETDGPGQSGGYPKYDYSDENAIFTFTADHPFVFFIKGVKEQIFAGVYAGYDTLINGILTIYLLYFIVNKYE